MASSRTVPKDVLRWIRAYTVRRVTSGAASDFRAVLGPFEIARSWTNPYTED